MSTEPQKPRTAEELMRARYQAYVDNDIDFVVDSHHPEGRDEVDREAAAKWAEEADWKGLEVLETVAGGPDDDEGVVEFVARYEMGGAPYTHHERARFQKLDGDWYYVEGDMVKQKPVVRETPKVGRNEPCPCGSGKKYKKCHGAA
jgi:SEC-C motif domain protein